ncbi:prolyl 4-hydroxylase subunit alpha-2-like isoform X2 [Physella acuta]|uniref:prolyl 4-hydroxylase subunit alpha-2-like isoform X2 n=1 Tax=Physella acuta TaxID=109671 RepID=UPI0027DE4846|nr:prolyl 4-hydroxylase subunit alpha-2-like isoform X2 [Physella acuta]
MYCVSVTVLTLSALLSLTSSEMFTSSNKVQRMVMDEERMLGELKLFIDQKYDWLKKMSIFYFDRLRDVKFRDDSLEGHDLYHPNTMYLAIQKFANDYSPVLGNNLQNFLNIQRESGQIFLADKDDIAGARKSLVILQVVFKMSALDMARGDYLGFQGPPLKSNDAILIGARAFSEEHFNECIEWMNASITLYNSTDSTSLATIPEITAVMGRAYLRLGDRARAEQIYDEVKLLEPAGDEVGALGHELNNQVEFEFEFEPPDETFQNYSRLCRLENRHHIPDPNNPRLVCRYRETLLPYYRFKEEILSVAPFVSVIYNVISDAEGDHLKGFVSDKLQRGQIQGIKAIASDIRTSDLAWIGDQMSGQVSNISKRIGYITGLDTSQRKPDGLTSAEDFQNPPPWVKRSGHRLATFLIYLSDVQRGGSTVFPKIGIAVAPVKNMALFWYNFDPAYEVDLLTKHGGCPVLYGHKWICTKWIWTYGNTLRRRCGLTPEATQLDIEPDIKRGYKS